MKICTEKDCLCKEKQPLENFTKSWSGKDGYTNVCRICKNRLDRLRNLRPEAKLRNSEYYQANKLKLDAKNRDWVKENSERRKEILKKSDKKVRSTIKGKLNHRISSAIYSALKGQKGKEGWLALVDYSLEDLIKSLESKFRNGMNWENINLWEIDHIIPKSWFSYTSPEDQEFKKCWGLDNLQPLWKEDNRKKSNKFIG